ncbi:MAG: response regulator, partial [Acidobacteria bacterium]|nr:response regulator [Acidobacteriota bacterium]
MSPSRPSNSHRRVEPTVLIVDDDPSAVEFLKTVIAQSPRVPRYRVTSANSGFRAEQACRTLQPAVVLLDLMLPDADGIDVLRALKAIDRGLEVIVISGQGSI